LVNEKNLRFKEVKNTQRKVKRDQKPKFDFDNEDMTKDEETLHRKFLKAMSLRRFNEVDEDSLPKKESKQEQPIQSKKSSDLPVYDFEDNLDKDAENLDAQYYRIGFKEEDDASEDPLPNFDDMDPSKDEEELDKQF